MLTTVIRKIDNHKIRRTGLEGISSNFPAILFLIADWHLPNFFFLSWNSQSITDILLLLKIFFLMSSFIFKKVLLVDEWIQRTNSLPSFWRLVMPSWPCLQAKQPQIQSCFVNSFSQVSYLFSSLPRHSSCGPVLSQSPVPKSGYSLPANALPVPRRVEDYLWSLLHGLVHLEFLTFSFGNSIMSVHVQQVPVQLLHPFFKTQTQTGLPAGIS